MSQICATHFWLIYQRPWYSIKYISSTYAAGSSASISRRLNKLIIWSLCWNIVCSVCIYSYSISPNPVICIGGYGHWKTCRRYSTPGCSSLISQTVLLDSKVLFQYWINMISTFTLSLFDIGLKHYPSNIRYLICLCSCSNWCSFSFSCSCYDVHILYSCCKRTWTWTWTCRHGHLDLISHPQNRMKIQLGYQFLFNNFAKLLIDFLFLTKWFLLFCKISKPPSVPFWETRPIKNPKPGQIVPHFLIALPSGEDSWGGGSLWHNHKICRLFRCTVVKRKWGGRGD